MKDLDRLIEGLKGLEVKLAEQGIYTAGTCTQAANTLRDQGVEIEEKHRQAQKCLDDADNMLEAQSEAMQEEIEKLREQLEEARGECKRKTDEHDRYTQVAYKIAETASRRKAERDRLKAALEKAVTLIDKVYMCEDRGLLQKESEAFEEIKQVLTPQEVCEECGGSGERAIPIVYQKGDTTNHDLTEPCSSCQPQTPGDVIMEKEKCPWCGEEDVHPPISRFAVRGKDALQFRQCKKCKGYWQAVYSYSRQITKWDGCDTCGDPRPHYAPECPYDPPENPNTNPGDAGEEGGE